MSASLRLAPICLLALMLVACDRAPPTPKTQLGESVNVSYAEIQPANTWLQAGDCKACHTV